MRAAMLRAVLVVGTLVADGSCNCFQKALVMNCDHTVFASWRAPSNGHPAKYTRRHVPPCVGEVLQRVGPLKGRYICPP